MKGSGFPGLKPINKQQGFSLHQLSKWNQQLDNDRLKTIHDQQDIKKQKKIAKQSSVYVNNSIQQIQDEARQISRQIEEEKTKHEQLNFIVKKLQQQIYSQKLEKYEDVINNKQTDEFQEQKKILKEKQKKLQKILDKLNSSDFQISKKIDTIRSLKKERGIHSNLFDKLEREYFDVEFYYKQLLIERTLKEKNLQYLVEQFNKVYHSSNNPKLKIQSSSSQDKQNLVQSQLTNTKTQQKSNSKILQLNFSRQKQTNLTQALKTKKEINQSKRNAQQSLKIEYKRKVNYLLNDFECNSYEEFLKKDIHQIHRKQEQVLTQVNDRYEDICKLKDQIKSLEVQINQKRRNRHDNKNKHKSNIPTKLSKLQSEISQNKQQIYQFKHQLNSLLNKLITQKEKSPQYQDQILMQKIQINKNHPQNFSQNIQLLKLTMAYFNDKLLETQFSNPNSIKRSIKQNPTQKSSQSLKIRKSSIIKLQRKTKKIQTQTSQNQNALISTGNFQCLNEIFTKYQNDSEKPGKSQKFDTVTLLTEKQFIVESKRLIFEASKKKSLFGKEAQTIKK